MIAFLQIRVELRYKRSLDKNFDIISAFSKGNLIGCTSMKFVIIIFNHILNKVEIGTLKIFTHKKYLVYEE